MKWLPRCAAALIASLASACGEGPATVSPGIRSASTWSSFMSASSDGPLYLEVKTPLFGLGQKEFADKTALALTDAIPGRPVNFTTDRDAAPRPNIRTLVIFNPAPGLSARDAFEGTVKNADPGPDKIEIMMLFANRDEVLVSIKGWVKKVKDADDPRFGQLLRQAFREMIGNPT